MATFICRYGRFQYEVVPFGLKSSGATSLRIIDNFLANVSNVKCYGDDLIVHSATMEEQVKHLEEITLLLRKHGLRTRLSK